MKHPSAMEVFYENEDGEIEELEEELEEEDVEDEVPAAAAVAAEKDDQIQTNSIAASRTTNRASTNSAE